MIAQKLLRMTDAACPWRMLWWSGRSDSNRRPPEPHLGVNPSNPLFYVPTRHNPFPPKISFRAQSLYVVCMRYNANVCTLVCILHAWKPEQTGQERWRNTAVEAVTIWG